MVTAGIHVAEELGRSRIPCQIGAQCRENKSIEHRKQSCKNFVKKMFRTNLVPPEILSPPPKPPGRAHLDGLRGGGGLPVVGEAGLEDPAPQLQ